METLQDLKEREYERYFQFWDQFGRALKEGVSSDYDNKEKILPLLLFQSSNDTDKLTTLKGYIERMKEGQNEIYYLTCESRRSVENSPQLEVFKEKGYEVLYLVEPVDELLVQSLTEYESVKLKSVGNGAIKLGSEEEGGKTQQELKQKEEAASGLLNLLQNIVEIHMGVCANWTSTFRQ